MEHKRGIEEAKAHQMQADSQRIKVAEEERRKTMEQEAYQQQKSLQYSDQLKRKRSEEERSAQSYMKDQERMKNEESSRKMEAERRATLAQELEVRAKAAKDRAMAEAEGRIVQERRNHDLKMKELAAEGDQKLKTMLESIKLVGTTVGEGISSYFNDTDKMIKTVGTLTAIAVGIYTAKVGTGKFTYINSEKRSWSITSQKHRILSCSIFLLQPVLFFFLVFLSSKTFKQSLLFFFF